MPSIAGCATSTACSPPSGRPGREVAHELQLRVPYEVLDGIPVPVMARCRGNRHRCFANEVGIGCGGSDHDWYYGVQLLPGQSARPDQRLDAGSGGDRGTLGRGRLAALASGTPGAGAHPGGIGAPLFGHDHPARARLGPTGPIGPALSGGQRDARRCWGTWASGVRWHAHWQQDYHTTVLTQTVYDTCRRSPRGARANRPSAAPAK